MRLFIQEDIDRLENFISKNGKWTTTKFVTDGRNIMVVSKYSTDSPLTGYDRQVRIEPWDSPCYFIFSVSKARRDDFFKILNSFISQGIKFGDSSTQDNYKNINIGDIFNNYTEMEHRVQNTDFVRFQYKIGDPLTGLIVLTLIHDTISFFEKMWGYDENGKEISLIKYPIGGIVSLKGENPKCDYMILSYEFERPSRITDGRTSGSYYYKSSNHKDEYCVSYNLIKIESQGTIIKYGNNIIVGEEAICQSRSNNLDILLN